MWATLKNARVAVVRPHSAEECMIFAPVSFVDWYTDPASG